MLLLDENKNLIDYTVRLKNDKTTQKSVELKLIELLSNPTISENKENSRMRSNNPDISRSMDSKIDSPLIIQTETIIEQITRTTRTISYDSPFTIAFLWNKLFETNFKFSSINKIYNDYLDLKSRIVDTNNLSLLFKEIFNAGEMNEFYSVLTKLRKLPENFASLYPDAANFSTMFPLTEFRNTRQTDSQIVEMYGNNRYGTEPYMDKLSRLVDLAENNTKILRTLNLQPNIIK